MNKKVVRVIVFMLIVLTVISIPKIFSVKNTSKYYEDPNIDYENVSEVTFDSSTVNKIYKVGTKINNTNFVIHYDENKALLTINDCGSDCDVYLGDVNNSSPYQYDFGMGLYTDYWSVEDVRNIGYTDNTVTHVYLSSYNAKYPINDYDNDIVVGKIFEDNTFIDYNFISMHYFNEDGDEICEYYDDDHRANYSYAHSSHYIGYCSESGIGYKIYEDENACWAVTDIDSYGGYSNLKDVELQKTDCLGENGITTSSVYLLWNDNGNAAGYRPSGITVKHSDGQSFYVDALDGTAVTLVNLPLTDGEPIYNGGYIENYIDYRWNVEGNILYYNVSVNKGSNNTTYITLTFNPETFDITGQVEWEDGNNQDGVRPSSVHVKLTGGNVTKELDVTADDNWTFSFDNLIEKQKNGLTIDYSITQTRVSNYDAPAITHVGNDYTITNSRTTLKKNITVTKVWDDDNNRYGLRPESVTVKLLADGYPVKDENNNDVIAVLNAGNNWTYTFSNYPRNSAGEAISYTVSEEAIPHYGEPEITVTNQSDSSISYEIKSAHSEVTKDIKIQIVWDDDDNKDKVRPESLSVSLMAGDEKALDENNEPLVAELNDSNNWTHVFRNVPKYQEGEPIIYGVIKEAVDKYGEPEVTVLLDDDALKSIMIKNVYVSASTDEKEIENPNTSTGFIALILLVISSMFLFYFNYKKEKNKI